jgi:hypothetical protein
LWFPGYECSDPQTRQDFIVTRVPYPRYGVTIRRLDGTEISRIALREDDPGIQTTEVSIDQPDRVGRLRQIEQSPHGGLVELIINGTVIRVTFLPSTPPSAINTALIQQARAYGFDVTNVTPYLYVRNLNHSPYGIRRLRWRSTDTGITRSDLGLYPEGDPAIALP